MLKTPGLSKTGANTKNASLRKVFNTMSGKNSEIARTAPNTPEDDNGVTVIASEIDPSMQTVTPLIRQQIPSPLRVDHKPVRGAHRSFASKSSAVREEKKEDHPSKPAEASAGDVVCKTLNFIEDMCAIQTPPTASASGTDNTQEPATKGHSVLQTNIPSYTAMQFTDDDNTSPSSYSGLTTQSSVNRLPPSQNTKINGIMREKLAKKPESAPHDHENFEVVLDPASYKEEKSHSSKQPKKRWPRLSKSLANSLSNSFPNEHAHSSSKSAEEIDNKTDNTGSVPAPERAESPQSKFADDGPMDETVGRLGELQEQTMHEGDEDQPTKGSSRKPKELAKKIWKNCKKIQIPVLKGESQQQHHRAEVDTEAAVARRSLQITKNLEEQEFVDQGSPKEKVDPIMEESESQADATDMGVLALDSNPNRTKSILNTTNDSSFLESSLEEDDESPRLPVAEKKTDTMNASGQSVEVSSSVMKPSSSTKSASNRVASLGYRLKKIQKSAYFKKPRMGGKKLVQENVSPGPSNVVDNLPSDITPVVPTAEEPSGADVITKPKLVWKAVVDPNTGRTYYYHRKTRETTWTKPEQLKKYEIEYQKWLGATSGTPETRVEAAKEENEEVVASIVAMRTSSSPQNSAPIDLGEENKKMKRASTEPQELVPSKITEEPKKSVETEKLQQKPHEAVETEKKVEVEKEVKLPKEKTGKGASDDSKPFDEATPFDEPLGENGPGLLFLPKSPARLSRNMTYMSKASARSALTDRTEKIKNTGKGKFSAFNAINENMSNATSISSVGRPGRALSPSARIPSRVPVHRERQLMVEELTDARISAESYEGKSGEKRGRIVRGRAHNEVELPGAPALDGVNEATEDYGISAYDNDTYGTDSVSALSENDTDFLSRRDNFDQARRRALDAAIEVEDWDLAAALSDGLRASNSPGGYEKAHSSWNQSELDKFIANNDWSAVKSYIARMREQSKKQQGNGSRRTKGQVSAANKRLGSRSQMQHREMISEDSWSGSDSGSSYETYDSESQI